MAEKATGDAPKKAQTAGSSKMDCVRQAMAKLGFDAGRAEIQSFVKKQFGIEMNLDVVSSYKADIARKAAKAKAAMAKKPETRAAAPAAKTAVASKLPAKVEPAQAVKKPAAPAQVAKKPAVATSKPQAKPSPTSSGNGKANGGIGLTDIQAVKDLVGRVGQDSLKKLVDVLAK